MTTYSIRIEDEDAVITTGTTTNEFRATVDLHEGANKLTAVGLYSVNVVGEQGNIITETRAVNATTNAVMDTTAPYIILSSIKDGMVTTESEITIAGSLDDLRSNLSDTQEPTVTINGIPVTVINRSFELADYLLQPGINIIQVQATDPHGNSKIEKRTITYLHDAGQKIIEIEGNNQITTVGEALDEPLVVKLVDRNNLPIKDRAVTFKVTEGDGVVTDLPREGRDLTVITNDQGLAQVNYQLGKRSGAGKHQVTVSAIGFPGILVFCASAQSSEPHRIDASRGSFQTGMMGSVLPEPLVSRVSDENDNAISGVSVKYSVFQGGGYFIDKQGQTSTETTLTTDIDGHASVDFVLGNDLEQSGYNSQIVKAMMVINGVEQTLNATQFTANSLKAGNVDETTITGLVLDNSNQPIPNVEVSLQGEFFATTRTLTNELGQFEFKQAPVGTVHLGFDGSTTTRDGEWPRLMYELVTVSGQENTVGMPVYIPTLNYEGGKIAGGDQQVIIPMRGVAGAEVIIAPNSVTLPDGRTEGHIMFSQVQTDKVPMLPPNGATFDMAWTLQPAGTDFDPPARISLPNSFGASPGEEREMFSFDHDLMEWVSIGPGVVTEDGSRIISREGHGVRHAGWGGAPPPPEDSCQNPCKGQEPGECFTLSAGYCFCEKNPLGTETVTKAQAEGDCATNTCGGAIPASDPPEDQSGDCAKPSCSSTTVMTVMIPDDDPPEQQEGDYDYDCKSCIEGDFKEDVEKDDSCCEIGFCETGKCVDVQIDSIELKANNEEQDIFVKLDEDIAKVNFTSVVDAGECDLEYEWDFGDGSTSNEQNPEHEYSSLGDYTVNLEIKCKQTDCVSDSKSINLSVIEFRIEPPDNPNPNDNDWVTNFSFLSNAPISAEIFTSDRVSSFVEWEVTATQGNVQNYVPANRIGEEISFEADITHPAYDRARRSGGSLARAAPLSYRISAEYDQENLEDEVVVTQDQRDRIRQEYVNHLPYGGVPVPDRNDLSALVNTAHFGAAELSTTPYDFAYGNPGALAEDVRAAFNREIDRELGVTGSNYGLRITSGWRNPEHNEYWGGVPNSNHTRGGAVDLTLLGSTSRLTGLTRVRLFQLLFAAASSVNPSEVFCERNTFNYGAVCTATDITHVHVAR